MKCVECGRNMIFNELIEKWECRNPKCSKFILRKMSSAVDFGDLPKPAQFLFNSHSENEESPAFKEHQKVDNITERTE